MNIIDKYRSDLEKKLNEKNTFTDSLAIVEAKTGVKRIYLVGGLIAFIILYLTIGYGAQFLANFIGFLYPAYCSVKAIESKEKDDDTKWLTYWVVYAAFSLLEFFTDILLFWIPLYSLLKCIFFVYCMAPTSWNGSLMIYHRLIKPFVLRHQQKIDSALAKASEMASELAEEVLGFGRKNVNNKIEMINDDTENKIESDDEQSNVFVVVNHWFRILGLTKKCFHLFWCGIRLFSQASVIQF